MNQIQLSTAKKTEFIDITTKVERIVETSRVTNGLCVIFSPHTSAGLTINENADPSVRKDIINQLDKIAPRGANYVHLEGNADAHIKASLLGSSLNVIIKDNSLVLGTWQGIYFCEFDGPRQRRVYVNIIGDR